MEVKIASLTHLHIKTHPLWKDVAQDDQLGVDLKYWAQCFWSVEGRARLGTASTGQCTKQHFA
jgi:hypothetical protein